MISMGRPVDESLTRVELARLEGTVSALVNELKSYREAVDLRFADHEKRIDIRLADHEGRIRVNERWRLLLPPTFLASILAVVSTFLHVHS